MPLFSPFLGGSFTKARVRSCCRWEVLAGLIPSFDHVLLWQWDLKTNLPWAEVKNLFFPEGRQHLQGRGSLQAEERRREIGLKLS